MTAPGVPGDGGNSGSGDGGTDDAETDAGDATDESVAVEAASEASRLRPGADGCTKVGACDAACPVAAVDDEFAGPQFQGPEQWRLARSGAIELDESLTKCSNCLRCDTDCPSGVPLGQMHNLARGTYVRDEQPFSIEKVRNRLLANYRSSAWLASKAPRTANAVLNNGAVRWLVEKTLKIPREREFPAFATETFREWWDKRGGAAASERRARAAREQRGGDAASKRRAREARVKRGGDDASERRDDAPADEKRVAYFHGCYANYNTTQVAKAMVRVYEALGYAVTVPTQKCSGTPMFANGRLDDARRHARVNVEHLGAAIDRGADVICTCTSCSLALRKEYPELFDIDGIDELAAHTYDALEYLRIHEDLDGLLADASAEGVPDVAYHAPCHARNQGLGRQAVELFDPVEGVEVIDVGDSCSGISGTYGWKAEKYETSMAIGEEMFEAMAAADAEHGMTECPTCAMQMEHGTGYEITHPIELLEAVLT